MDYEAPRSTNDESPARLTPGQWERSKTRSYEVAGRRLGSEERDRMSERLEGYSEQAVTLTAETEAAVMKWARTTVGNARMVGFISETIGRTKQGSAGILPRIPPPTRSHHWEAARPFFESSDEDEALAGALVFYFLSVQQAAYELHEVRYN